MVAIPSPGNGVCQETIDVRWDRQVHKWVRDPQPCPYAAVAMIDGLRVCGRHRRKVLTRRHKLEQVCQLISGVIGDADLPYEEVKKIALAVAPYMRPL